MNRTTDVSYLIPDYLLGRAMAWRTEQIQNREPSGSRSLGSTSSFEDAIAASVS
ncbi:hypothetical protein [Laspinema olomoucense]|uniref:hypothetical protein n=1 Tax=Laspinema olomoucense TaxID=3231600 RepID=UPI0021BB481F|nr:hypothetical protein [Laspinema sp. D3a]MCT7986987.1 hypothetical protein [Laspinema sp. D3a]